MQNDKETKVFKLHEKIKILRKNFDEQTKGTPSRKMITQTSQYRLRLTTFQNEKKRETESKQPNKQVFIYFQGSKTPGSRDREISFPPDFQGGL